MRVLVLSRSRKHRRPRNRRRRRSKSIRIEFGSHGSDTFFEVQHETVGRVTVEIVSMKTFTAEEAQPFVEFYGCCVCDFRFKDDLIAGYLY